MPYETEENVLDITKLKYVLYARKSTDDPKRQLRSIPDQIDECKSMAERLSIRIVDIVKEKKSAKTPNKRPKFNQVLKDIRQGKYDGILSWNPDRLARNMLEGGKMIDMVDNGVIKDLKFVTHTFSNDPNGKMLLGMAFVLSKQYSDKLSVDVTRGVRKRHKQGKSPAHKYGYIRDEDGLYRPSGKNFSLIKEAWKMRLEGTSLRDISVFVNEGGYVRIIRKKNKPDKKLYLNHRQIGKMFHDPFYYGVLVQANQTVDLREIYDFEPAVDEEDFFSIQKMSTSKKPSVTKKRRAFYPLQKMIICDFCHTSMYIAPSTSSSKKKTRYLIANCQNQECFRKSEKYQGKKTCRMKIVFDTIYEILKDGLSVTEKDYNDYIRDATALTEKKRIDKRSQLNSKQGLLKRVSMEIQERSLKIVDYEKGTTIHNQNAKRIEELSREKARLEHDIERLKNEIDKVPNELLSIEQFSNLAKKAKDVVEAGSGVQKDRICRYIFSNLYIGDNKVTKYRLNPPFDILLKDGNGGSSRLKFTTIEPIFTAIADLMQIFPNYQQQFVYA